MAECGAAREAVAQFGDAARLGSRALVAEPALQVSLLRLAGTSKTLRHLLRFLDATAAKFSLIQNMRRLHRT